MSNQNNVIHLEDRKLKTLSPIMLNDGAYYREEGFVIPQDELEEVA